MSINANFIMIQFETTQPTSKRTRRTTTRWL